MTLCFLSAEGKPLLTKKLIALPVHERVVLQKSVEFFNDPEPCMIHRSAVLKRLYLEIEQALGNRKQWPRAEFPELLCTYIAFPEAAYSLVIE